MAKNDAAKLDDLILSRARLGILSALLNGDEVDFSFLKKNVGLTDGNLSVQIRKLEDAGLIKVKKTFVERKPRTFCRITAQGRGAVVKLFRHLEGLVGNE